MSVLAIYNFIPVHCHAQYIENGVGFVFRSVEEVCTFLLVGVQYFDCLGD